MGGRFGKIICSNRRYLENRSQWCGQRGALSLSSPSPERGYTLGKGPSVGLLHLGHDIFDGFGHQASHGKIFCPVDRVSETLNEWWFCEEGEGSSG